MAGIDPTTLLLVAIAALGYVVKTYLEASGKVRSNKVLREENADLAERKKTLEHERAALVLQVAEGKASELKLLARIEALELKVRELEAHDQAAVLKALKDHESGAIERAKQTHELQRETARWLERIATTLDSQ